MRSYLKTKLFAEGFAPLEAFEEVLQDADDDGVDAHPFLFRPLLQGESGFGANVKQLGIRQRKAGLSGLLDLYFILIDMRQSEKDDPRKITPRLLGHCFPQVDGKSESHARPVVGLWLLLSGLASLNRYRLHEFLGFSYLRSCLFGGVF